MGKEKKTKPRDYNAVAAHQRKAGPHKHKNEPRGGAKKELYEEEYTPSNREKAAEPHPGKNYCMACDGALVGVGGACPRCGAKEPHRRRKK